jgi:hypothetical protein
MSQMFQQVLVMETEGEGMRSEAVGWTAEDPRGAHPTKPVGLCGVMWHGTGQYSMTPDRGPNNPYDYPDVLRALADGWQLMAPPTDTGLGTWEWWFSRMVSETRK